MTTIQFHHRRPYYSATLNAYNVGEYIVKIPRSLEIGSDNFQMEPDFEISLLNRSYVPVRTVTVDQLIELHRRAVSVVEI